MAQPNRLEIDRRLLDEMSQMMRLSGIELTGNTFEFYCDVFRIKPERLKGKKVLDIGGGTSSFTPRLISLGVDAYSLDPRYHVTSPESLIEETETTAKKHEFDINELSGGLEEFRRSIEEYPERYITGYATHLQFPDNHFDLVVSNLLIVWHLARDKYFETVLREMLRVSKYGKDIKIHPAPPTKKPVADTMMESVAVFMKEHWPKVSKKRKVDDFQSLDLIDEEIELVNAFILYMELMKLLNEDVIHLPTFFETTEEDRDDQVLVIRKKIKTSTLPSVSGSV